MLVIASCPHQVMLVSFSSGVLKQGMVEMLRNAGLSSFAFALQPDLMHSSQDAPKSYSSVEDLFGTGSRRSKCPLKKLPLECLSEKEKQASCSCCSAESSRC